MTTHMYFQTDRRSDFKGVAMNYDIETRTLRYLIADDSNSLCCTLTGISADQALDVLESSTHDSCRC